MGREVPDMMLHTLLRQFDPQHSLTGIPDIEIAGVREDSRLVQRGELFIARSGTKTSGIEFIADAFGRGAVAALPTPKSPASPLPQVVVEAPARAAALLANLFHGIPSRKMRTFAVT